HINTTVIINNEIKRKLLIFESDIHQYEKYSNNHFRFRWCAN
ncbi:MAG: hypothetical protein RL642_223, partial [Bacteroidota bacterium]